jgi:hypothetical protein
VYVASGFESSTVDSMLRRHVAPGSGVGDASADVATTTKTAMVENNMGGKARLRNELATLLPSVVSKTRALSLGLLLILGDGDEAECCDLSRS